MARVQETVVTIKITKLIRDNDKEVSTQLLTSEDINSLTMVIEEMAGAGALVEIS